MQPEEPEEKPTEQTPLNQNEEVNQKEIIDFTKIFPCVKGNNNETLNYESWGFHNY